MKALILMGSPHKNGDTAVLVEDFMKNFKGDSKIIYLYSHLQEKGIKPCIDCGYCKKEKGCIIPDDFKELLADDYDVLVIASPIYMSNLTPPLWSVISRFNYVFNNKQNLSSTITFKEKIGVVLLVAGGSSCKMLMQNTNDYLPLQGCKYIFGKVNAKFDEDNHYILSNNTEEIHTEDNIVVREKVKILANKLSN